MRDLREHPDVIETAVEEFLRMESSNQLGNRRAVSDTTLGGVGIAAGTYVHIGIGAANRDPDQFPDPDRLDIRRQPNRHLAFATGIHACAGMSLARMEAQVAIGRLLQRFARIERSGRSCAAAAPASAVLSLIRCACAPSRGRCHHGSPQRSTAPPCGESRMSNTNAVMTSNRTRPSGCSAKTSPVNCRQPRRR